MSNQYRGTWRIIEMEQWDQDYINLVVPGYIALREDNLGEFQLGCLAVPCSLCTRLEQTHVQAAGATAQSPRQGAGARQTGKDRAKHPCVLVLGAPWAILLRLTVTLQSSMGADCCIPAPVRHTYATRTPLILGAYTCVAAWSLCGTKDGEARNGAAVLIPTVCAA